MLTPVAIPALLNDYDTGFQTRRSNHAAMRILLIGAGGQLAGDLLRALTADEVISVSHAELDIGDAAGVDACAERVRPECIVNTAAFHRVDECEDRADEALRVNAVGVLNLARAAERFSAKLVHVSTNYVFDGSLARPYVESDAPRPQSVYAISKLAGEIIAMQYCSRHFVLRTAGLYGFGGSRSRGGNFVETMLRLAREGKPIRVVNDQILGPTSTRDFAQKLAPLLHTESYGLFHMTNAGACSWYEFAREIFRLESLAPDCSPVASDSFPQKARRPAYSVLDNRAYRGVGFADFKSWQEALAEYLSERRCK
jgi:dTDP-4-dehydrorhamnose reductase